MALHGVNLGGWFILERWMTPWVFEGTDAGDEFSFMQIPGALSRLREHQKTFITEKDFQWMTKAGVQIVRIPVGYWVLEGDEPYVASSGRLDWAFRMCEKYNIKVLLDIHALPGSQNGHDHSGRTGRAGWFEDKVHQQDGLRYTVEIAKRYADSPVLWGVQIINEPRITRQFFAMRRYYRMAYRAVSAVLPPTVTIVYSDAFLPRIMNGVIAARRNPTAMDIHWYHFVGWGWLSVTWWRRLTKLHGRLIRSLKKSNGIIIGEWSGIYMQRLFDNYPQREHIEMVRQNIRDQQAAYSNADAWFYWNYKAAGPGVWDFKSLVDDGILVMGRQ